jgi:hypothetical protein
MCLPGMTSRVGEGLLHDAKRGEVDPRWQRSGGALDACGHLQSGSLGLGDELIETGEPRSRRAGRGLVAFAEYVEDRSQLTQGLVARLLDGGQRGPRLLGTLVHQVQRDARLDVDE